LFESGILMIDLHCHILPGLDDGSPNLATSLEMARIALNDGIETIVATPHSSVDAGPTPAQIRMATQQLQVALADHDLPLTILPGAEVRAHPDLMALIAEGQIMTIADQGDYLLLEPPLIGVPNYLEQLCFQLQIAGITPLLAHPERTELYRQEPQVYQRLAERGCLLQVNAESIRGSEGRSTRNNSLRLLRDGLTDILASDAHNATSRPPVLSDVRREVMHIVGKDAFHRMTQLVPAILIRNAEETAI